MHWLYVIPTALIKLFVCTLCLMSGQAVAILYAVSELLCTMYGLWNGLTRRNTDTSDYAFLIPVLYWLSSVIVPTHTTESIWLTGCMGILIVLQIVSYLYLGRAYSMGVSTYTGRVINAGPYQLIRHPQLVLQLLRRFVFVLANLCLWNLFSGCFFLLAVVTVILVEERYLSRFVEYKRYAHSVPYRLLPRIW